MSNIDRQKDLKERLAKARVELDNAQTEYLATPLLSPESKRARERVFIASEMVEQLRKEVGMVSFAEAMNKARMEDYR